MNTNYLAQIDFDALRKVLEPKSEAKIDLSKDLNIGQIISQLLPYILSISGLILFIFLIMGGFEMLTSAGNPESVKKAQEKITSALIGFVIILLAWWLTQVLEIIFGITIL